MVIVAVGTAVGGTSVVGLAVGRAIRDWAV
jgi:hypothetical protein